MESLSNPTVAIADIDGLLAEMRPMLHRYCARMVGSVIDGEDVLQDALIKAVESLASAGAIRAMIADDVRLDLVNKTRMNGKAEVSKYFGNYSKVSDWHLVPGLVEGRPSILVFDPNVPGSGPKYFMLLRWSADQVETIRDFRHAAYVIDGAEYRI